MNGFVLSPQLYVLVYNALQRCINQNRVQTVNLPGWSVGEYVPLSATLVGLNTEGFSTEKKNKVINVYRYVADLNHVICKCRAM